jgi:hypothetical protein
MYIIGMKTIEKTNAGIQKLEAERDVEEDWFYE